MTSTKPYAIELHYHDEGRGELVLLLHGLGSSTADWQLQTPVLARKYRVIVPDLRGHGNSPKPPGPYDMATLADDVVALMDTMGLDRAHIIGLSMGGMIGFQLAVDRPERVRSLVVVNSTPDLVPRTLQQRLQVQQRLWLARIAGPQRTGKFISRRLFPKEEQALLREMLVAQWAENDKDAYVASMEACIGWSVLSEIGRISCPVLVISGDRDYTPVDAKRAYTAMIPGAELVVVEDSGHATPIDQSEAFNRLILAFLDRVSDTAE